MFCPTDKDYYLAVFTLIAFLNACKVLWISIGLPFFSLITNVNSFSYSVYDTLLTLGLLALPFIPPSIQVILPFTIILLFHLPMRLPQTFIHFILDYLLRPVTNPRESKPETLILFTSLLSYYRLQLQEIGQSQVNRQLSYLILTLTGIMAHHCLPNCHVVSVY